MRSCQHKNKVSHVIVARRLMGVMQGPPWTAPVSHTVKVVPAAVEGEREAIVAGFIASLKVAVEDLLMNSPVSPLAAPVVINLGAVVSGVAPAATGPRPPPPRMGSLDPLPHPATKATSSNAVNHVIGLVILSNLFICFSLLSDPKTSALPTDPLLVLDPSCCFNIQGTLHLLLKRCAVAEPVIGYLQARPGLLLSKTQSTGTRRQVTLDRTIPLPSTMFCALTHI